MPPASAMGDSSEPNAPDSYSLEASLRRARLIELGRHLFEDPQLSASGTLSCAGCHDAKRAFTGNHRGGASLFPVSTGAFSSLQGTRNTPTAMYTAFSPEFRFIAEKVDRNVEYTPTGGQFWDGRADTLAQQAKAPFLNPREMALPDTAALIERVRSADYASLFEEVYGAGLGPDFELAYDRLTKAIAAYESTEVFAPFNAKFDAVLRGTAQFTRQEARGFELFKDPKKGNCIACHAGDPTSHEPRAWLFTDFTYDILGVPRNSHIPDNADPEHFDLGLCEQPGLRERVPGAVGDRDAFVAGLCGAFKVPTLRNVAKTAPYMHNGFFKTLRDVVTFYATRDTNPGKWYPKGPDGSVRKFDDLPAAYKANVNTSEAPYDRRLGEAPRLDQNEIDAIVAFLGTLSDESE